MIDNGPPGANNTRLFDIRTRLIPVANIKSARKRARQALLDDLGWEGPVFEVSAATGAGTEALGHAVMQALERMDEEEAAEA